MRAKVGGSTPEHNSLDEFLASHAGLVFTIINAMKKLETARFPIGVDVVSQRAAAMVDGAAEDQFDGAVESKNLLAREAICRNSGADAALEKGFIGINVADASH